MADSHPAARFRNFAEIARPESPLYFALATAIADDVELLSLTDEMIEHQPPPNVLLAAVHFLILRGADHELMEYFASVGGERQPDGHEIDALREFIRGTFMEHFEVELLFAEAYLAFKKPRREQVSDLLGKAWLLARERDFIFGYRSDIRESGENSATPINLQVSYFITESGGSIYRTLGDLLKRLQS